MLKNEKFYDVQFKIFEIFTHSCQVNNKTVINIFNVLKIFEQNIVFF